MKKLIPNAKHLLFWLSLVVNFVAFNVNAQTVISRWTFETGTYTTGSCSADDVLLGTVGSAVKTEAAMTCTSAGGLAPTAGAAMNTSTYPASGTGNKTRGVQFSTNTTGFTNIKFKFDLRCSNTANNTVVLQYSTTGAGGPYTDAAMFTFTPAATGTGDTWNPVTATPASTPASVAIAAGASREFDLSAVTALNNNANVVFRVVSAFDPTTGNYRAATSSSTYAASGTMRFDNVEVIGTPTACAEPTVSASAVVMTPGATNINLSWTNGNGTGRIVVMRAGGAVTSAPADGTAYTANAVFGSGSTTAPGDFVVYQGTGTSVNVTGLTLGTNYCVAVYEYACSPINYKQPSPATACATTTAPTAPPTITPSATTTPYLGIAAPVRASGVINDPTDPAKFLGIDFTVADPDTPLGSLTVTATSSNLAVVNAAGITLTGAGTANQNIKINPIGVGYTTITVTVNDGANTASMTINYAASAASSTPATTRWHTGISDASTAVAIDANYMFVGDDETNKIYLYNRQNSGLPLYEFDYVSFLGLTDLSSGVPREIDLEASVRVGNRIYWLASHSNSSGGAVRPNRYRIFATDIVGTGASATLTYVGRYDNLRAELLNWDATNAHGLGADYFGFTASAATGIIPEMNDGSGFNIEGLVMAPGSTTTAYIAFRAPIVPATSRTRGLLIPVNLSALVTGSPTAPGTAVFGTPIQLNLGGRGIRSIDKNDADEYVIVAGPVSSSPTAPLANDFKLFRWNGSASSAPVALGADLLGMRPEGIVEVPNPLTPTSPIQLISDNGDDIWYGDGIISKDLTEKRFQKFRSDIVTASDIKFIHEVQGSGLTAAITGSVKIEGIVTAVYQTAPQVGGFFVQEEDTDADADPNTSEGIYVFTTTTPGPNAVSVGQKVRITGTVSEFFQMTQIGNTGLTVTVLSSGNPLPTPVNVTMPMTAYNDWEKYEGMLVHFPQELTVTEIFQLGRAGQVTLSADGKIQQFTHTNLPNVADYAAHQDYVLRNTIRLDDASLLQNPAPIIHPQSIGGVPIVGGLSALNTLRGGYTTTGMAGVLYESRSWTGAGSAVLTPQYRVFPTGVVDFTPANPRPTAPAPVPAGALKVASANLLNYFTTLQNAGSICGPTGDQDCRGANNATEFTRQRNKTLQMLLNLQADIVGLMEVENNGYGPTSAIQDLVNGLNALTAPGTWAFVNHGGTYLGNDVIKVGMIYKTTTVQLIGTPATVSTGAFSNFNRQPLAATFRQISNNEVITVCVNHFKSKGSVAATGNPLDNDQNDGQGASNAIRVQAANQLTAWLATNPTGIVDDDVLIIGDLNSYAKEDPIQAIEAAGYTNLLFNFHGDDTYSFVFDAEWGYLDHALASPCLTAQAVSAEDFHINSDEPLVLDYNTEFKTAGQLVSLYNADMYRTSDHDPVIVAFSLGTPEIAVAQGATALPSGSNLNFGSTSVGTSVTQTITITNTGTTVLNLNSVTVTPGYSILTTVPATLAPGASVDVEIRLNAVTGGSFSGNITILNNDCDENNYVIGLIGTVVGASAVIPPAAPAYLIAEAVNTRSIKLRWNDSMGDETGYEIYRSTDGSNFAPLTTTNPYSTAECVFIDSAGLSNDKAYFYIVRAVRGVAKSPFTNSAYDYTYPEVPTLFNLTNACIASSGTITVAGTHTTGKYRWYTIANGGEPIFGNAGIAYDAATYTTGNLQEAKTFYISARGHRYESATRLAVTVQILPRPVAQLSNTGTIYSCSNSAEITAVPYAGMVYDWFLNDNFLTTTTSPNFTATSSGVYALRVRNTANGCISSNVEYVNVKLNHKPLAQILEGNTASFCSSGTLTASAVADATYSWSKDGVVLGTERSVVVNTSGEYILTVTQFGCTATASVKVNVSTFPALNLTASETDICPGASTLLEMPAIAGATYSWYLNGRRIRVSNVNTFSANRSGTYTVVVENELGCEKTSTSLDVNVIEVPKARVEISGDKLVLVFEGTASTTAVKWFRNGVYLPEFDGKNNISPTAAGIYSVEFTLTSGCTGRSSGTFFILGTEDEVKPKNELTLIYPNPSKDVVNILLDENYRGKVSITFADNLGRVVFSNEYTTDGNEIVISVAQLPAGMYVIGITNENATTTFKFVKE